MKTKTKQLLIFAVALSVWTTLVLFQIDVSFGFGAVGFLGLALIALLLGFIVSVVIGILLRRWRVAIYFGTALFVVFSASWSARFISERQREASIEAAQPIILAAERFRSATGAYPQSLNELIPAFLPNEPRTKVGFNVVPFSLKSDSNRFRVTFALPGWKLCSYDSASSQWYISD